MAKNSKLNTVLRGAQMAAADVNLHSIGQRRFNASLRRTLWGTQAAPTVLASDVARMVDALLSDDEADDSIRESLSA